MNQAVLFDLDGTLADTAPDLAGALNRLLIEEHHSPLTLEQIRPQASNGVRGLLALGFNITPEHPNYSEYSKRILTHYENHLADATSLFPGIAELLNTLDKQNIPWGIVTNKVRRFTEPLVTALGLSSRSACIISGDSASHAKPHPAPLLLACATLKIKPEHTIYVGDDDRDIIAGRAAGMRTIAVRYGYLSSKTPIESWQADLIINKPSEILTILKTSPATC